MRANSKGRATLAAVAKASGVAVSTASLVLNNRAGQVGISATTEQTVRVAAQQLGYSPNRNARSLRLRRSGLVGVVLAGIASEAVGQMFEGIRSALQQSDAGMEPLLTSHEYDLARERKELAFLAQNSVDAVVASPFGPCGETYLPIVNDGIPVVFVAHGLPEMPPEVSGVFLDSEAMSHEAIQHLAKSGARRIAYIAWDYGTQMSREKLAGVHAAMRENPTSATLTGVIVHPAQVAFDASLDALFADPASAPDALLCNPFEAAIACLDYLDRRQIPVPARCAVMSLSDHPVFQMQRIAVTAMRQDFAFLGRRAAQIALESMGDNKRPAIIERHPAFQFFPRATTHQVPASSLFR